MKKFMAMFLVAASLLVVSCKKENETVKLAGTSWKSSLSVGNFQADYQISFITDTTGRLDMAIIEAGEPDVETVQFTYTFDGRKNGTMVLEDEPNSFTYSDQGSDNKPTITISLSPEMASEMGVSTLVFHKQ
ncbi:MAG: hypothetical protein IJ785_05280 [Bacteroidales bacterium]|nr:hypothetical protein [Bacteroidales bacterium]